MVQDRLAFEDFQPGRRFALPEQIVTEEEIVAFAEEFDPQPQFLMAATAVEGSGEKRLAPIWFVSSLFMRTMCDGYILNSTSQGSPGIDFMTWQSPVFAGDRLSATSTVLDSRLMRSRPGIGIVRFRHEVSNQNGEMVCVGENAAMFGTRTGSEAF